ncbi:hypothetical protein CA13_14570 [Planctomycetes bacterium CA13]|uniref:Leucine Rich repeats (2 copies) n=1 Tax=Novipirellula herctigrandis TaxID=2527986 RepID=A0A5C5YYB9_9BACT|nr:hypothetical protein CA13_14570 [Planctomycetes bacterium CA13]
MQGWSIKRIVLTVGCLVAVTAVVQVMAFLSSGRRRSVAASRLRASGIEIAFKNSDAGWFRDLVGDIIGDAYVHPTHEIRINETCGRFSSGIDWNSMCELSPIIKIEISDFQLSHELFSTISSLDIEQIWIRDCVVSDDARLSFPSTIQVLVVEDTKLGKHFEGALDNSILLEELWLDCAGIQAEQVVHLSLPTLKILSINGIEYIDPASLTHSFPSLQTLYVSRGDWSGENEKRFEEQCEVNVVISDE